MPPIRSRFTTLMLTLALGASISVFAQDARHAGESEAEIRQAPVVIDGESLFSVRGVAAWRDAVVELRCRRCGCMHDLAR